MASTMFFSQILKTTPLNRHDLLLVFGDRILPSSTFFFLPAVMSVINRN